MQGPYVYALYQYYGFSEGEVGKLFVAGFASSMVFGTFVGGLADQFGRKLACLMYALTYSVGCVLKAFPSFSILMTGRILAGISTSLLFSAFESWLVSTHASRGYPADLLSTVFARAVFWGNGVAAVVSGQLGHVLVDVGGLGPVAPFFVAMIFLGAGALIVWLSWSENFGIDNENSKQSSSSSSSRGTGAQMRDALMDQYRTFGTALSLISRREDLRLLGIIQSAFEAAMYTFVFMWTPALTPPGSSEVIPHGTIFACFMLACMLGSSLAGALMSVNGVRVEQYMTAVFGVAAAALAPPVFATIAASQNGSVLDTFDWALVFIGFLVFEACVGVFWPSLMKLRSEVVPEEFRSTIMNIFRIPLNAFVCVVLFNVGHLSAASVFSMCVSMLLLCAVLQNRLSRVIAERR